MGTEEVSRLACGASASLELFERAVEAGASLLIVHHGLLHVFELPWAYIDVENPV